jgi:hypothetical protein
LITGSSSIINPKMNGGIAVWNAEISLYPATYVESIDVAQIAPYN